MIALILVIIGAINWGLVGISPNFDLVALIGGGKEGVLAKIIYILVGISGIIAISFFNKFKD